MSLRALSFLLGVAALAGCATLSSTKTDGSLVYVAPFVDQTPGMELGSLATRSVQEALYARAPRRFLIVFDEAAVAVDGTVLAVNDVATDNADKRDVVVSVHAVVVDRRGNVRFDTGVVDRSARYAVSSDVNETAIRRERARAIATSTAGRALVDTLLQMP